MSKVPILIRFEPETHRRLKALAERTEFSIGEFVRFAVEYVLTDLERTYPKKPEDNS